MIIPILWTRNRGTEILINCPEAPSWGETGQMGSQPAWPQSSCFAEKQACPAPLKEISRNLSLLLPPEEPVAFLGPRLSPRLPSILRLVLSVTGSWLPEDGASGTATSKGTSEL